MNLDKDVKEKDGKRVSDISWSIPDRATRSRSSAAPQ